MKLWVTILAMLIGAAVVIGVMSQSRQTNAPADAPPAVAIDDNTDAESTADDAAQVAEAVADDDAEAVTDAGQTAPDELDQAIETAVNDEAANAAALDIVREPRRDPDQIISRTAAPSSYEPIKGLHPVEVTNGKNAVIGDDTDGSAFKMKVELSRYGAAVIRISLTDYLKEVGSDQQYIVHDVLKYDRDDAPTQWYAFAAKAVTINGTRIPLETNDVWALEDVSTDSHGSSATYSAILADDAGTPIVKIVRTYSLIPGSYDLALSQNLINLSGEPIDARWEQNLQGDLYNDSGYLGERRQFVTGYFAPWWDPHKAGIYTEDADQFRTKLVGSKQRNVWPPHGLNPEAELAWVGSLNRYFAVVTHSALSENVKTTADIPALESLFPNIDHAVVTDPTILDPKDSDKLMIIKASTGTISVPAGGEADLDLGIFAGPRKPELFETEPYSLLHLDQTIVYSLGGMCSFCTFQWLAHILLWLLKLFEGQVLILGGLGIGVHDWGVSIILLVALVRLLLHPITKRAQMNMMKMGKMMQSIQPEVEKLKKKYKDDQQKINAEMMKLYREKGVNPANMLGCLPMFLQTPIWIALYAMLYYAIELRHEPAFWGLFQSISNGSWIFLQDLSQADNFLVLADKPFKLNLLFIHPEFQSINILPLLMAVVFYFNQKLTTPPPANEQQAQQQKMMKFIVFLFPIFLYSAPSGLTLYILASTAAGVIDSAIVRKKIKEQEESGELFTQKPVKPGGLRDRIAKAVEAKQTQLSQQAQKQKQGQKPGGGDKKRKRK